MRIQAEFIDLEARHCKQLAKFYIIAFLAATFILGVCIWARAEEINIDIIATIESSNNLLAYNKISQAKGLYQITPICLKDYNNQHTTEIIASNALYNPIEARKVAEWYILRIKQILAKKGIPAQIRHILISYNWGVENCIKWYKAGSNYNKLPKETQNYLKRYAKVRQ